jgi:hypothetical protein
MRDLTGKGKPFYSSIDRAASLLRRKVGTGAEFMKELMAIPGIKQTEIQERGLGDIMGAPKMTHDQFMAALSSKPVPAIQEKVLGELNDKELFEEFQRKAMADFGRPYGELDHDRQRDVERWADRNTSHHEEYTLPGGENYREMLIKTPTPVDNSRRIMEIEAELRRSYEGDPEAPALRAELQNLKEQQNKQPKQFKGVGAHFGGEPGILASMRLKDRMVEQPAEIRHVAFNNKSGNPSPDFATPEELDAYIKTLPANIQSSLVKKQAQIAKPPLKLLHLEELQSDWHQQGREKGYGDTVNEQGHFIVGVPDAPFKKNWEEMALKRLIHHAAENGYHGIVVTPGQEQAERYGLEKHVKKLHYNADIKRLRAFNHSGREVVGQDMTPEELPKHLGQELAEKLLQQPKEFGVHTLEDQDVKVGGKGMKAFYDNKVPNILNSIGKKYGVKTELNSSPINSLLKNKIADLHYFPITEDMRKDVLTNGLPLYAEGGIIHKAAGGNVQPSLSEMKMALAQKSSPLDLKNVGLNEAINISPKVFFPPERTNADIPAPGGVATPSGMPIGGIDMSKQGGQQLMPQNLLQPQQPPQQPPQGPQGGLPTQGATPGGSNILSMTPQGQAMAAMKPQGLADGGSAKSVDEMKDEMAAKKKPKFAIAPSQVPTKGPEHFTPYDKTNPNKGGLQTAFDEAIAHHLSLSPEERMKNSVRASEAVGDIIGRTADGKVKDLLGKNAKLLKSEKGKDDEAVKLPDGRGIETTGLALAPAYREGKFDTCPNHHSCKEECLGKTSGNYFKLGGGQDLSEFKGPRLNSLLKTHAFMHDPHNFAVKLHDEISDAKAIAAQNGNHLGLRLNVLSDINPRIHKSIIEAHPDVTFYDYTKNNTDPIAPNHHYTYSSTGVSQPGVENEHTNWKSMRRRLLGGDNVAMAFSHKDHLPEFVHDQETGHKFRVVNGDTHDFRPLDIQPEGEHGVIVGLKNKKATGEMDKAHVDSKGFFVHYDPQLKMTKNAKGLPVYERKASTRISPKTNKPMLGETIPQNKMVNIQTQTRGMIPISNDGEKE